MMSGNRFERIFAICGKDDIITDPQRLIPMMTNAGFERADVLAMRTFIEECPHMIAGLLEGWGDPSRVSEAAAARTGVDPRRLVILLDSLLSASAVLVPGNKSRLQTDMGANYCQAPDSNTQFPDSAYVDVEELCIASHNAEELLSRGYKLEDLMNVGFSAMELKDAGFSAKEIKAAGFDSFELGFAGLGFQELSGQAGFTVEDYKHAGFTAKEIMSDDNSWIGRKRGFTAEELRRAGFTEAEIDSRHRRRRNMQSFTLMNELNYSRLTKLVKGQQYLFKIENNLWSN